MDGIFGVGPLELLLIIVIMLVVLGPKEMVVTARKVGKFIRDLVKSPYWAEIMKTTKEIREIPTKLVRDSGLEEDLKSIQQATKGQLDEINKITQEATNEVKKAVESTQTTWPKFDPLPAANQKPATTSPGGVVALPPEAVPPVEIMEPVTDVFAAAGLAPVTEDHPSDTVLPEKTPEISGETDQDDHKAALSNLDLNSQTEPLVPAEDQAGPSSPSVSN